MDSILHVLTVIYVHSYAVCRFLGHFFDLFLFYISIHFKVQRFWIRISTALERLKSAITL